MEATEQFELDVKVRDDLGKGASRRLRREGYLPAILYGAEQQPQNLSVLHSELIKHLRYEAFYSHILTLNIEGQGQQQVVLKDLQRHPSRPVVTHADFLRVDTTHKLTMHVPLHFLNEEKCVGVKQGGGVISHHVVEIEVRCLAKDLPEFIEVDLLNLNVGDLLHLSDIKCPEGIELVALLHGQEHNVPVVSVHASHGGSAQEEAPSEAE